jgi:hypothetical protein
MPGWSASIIMDTVTPKLAAFTSQLEGRVEPQLEGVGADMEGLARQLVHVRTGYLQSTIYHTASGFTLELGATADYASFNEFGTYRMGPFPFIRPALDAYSQRILDAILVGCMNALIM